MKDDQFKLFGQFMLVDISPISQKECFRCKDQLQDKKVWLNDFKSYFCFDCYPDQTSIDQLLFELNMQKLYPVGYPCFQAIDYRRLRHILNKNGHEFMKNQKTHSFIESSLQLQKWEFGLNSRKRVVNQTKFNPNCKWH